MRSLSGRKEWPPIAVYDIESTDWINVVLLCHIDELGNHESFDNVSDYVNWLFSDNFSGSHVWAHAGGRYDHRFLLPEFQRRGWDFRIALSGGSIVLLTARDKKGKEIYFADSFRIMPNALKSIGKTVGLEKIDVDRKNIQLVPREKLIEYCFRDCEIALRGLQLMKTALESVNADFAFTLASIASRWVRRSDSIDWTWFYKNNCQHSKDMLIADKFCEPAYFGGRTEMFKRGKIKGPVYYYDIVSSYPTSMQYELPLYFKGFVPCPRNCSETDIRKYLSYPGITEAWVNLNKCKIAPLCVKFDGRLTFPYGHKIGRQEKLGFPGTCDCGAPLRSHICRICHKIYPKYKWQPGRWTNIELLAALDRGAEILPICQARFKGAPFLKNFVDTFYNLRKQAKKSNDSFRTYAYKILLNSLYGKLVETIDRVSYVTSYDNVLREIKRGGNVQISQVSGIYCISSKQEGPFRHVASGAYVTAYSRLALLNGLETALKLGGQIFYCDTDSIMTDIKLDCLEGSELGQWQLEHIFSEVEIILPKVYKAKIQGTDKTIYRCKGVPIVREDEPEYVPELRWEAFKRYAETKDSEMAKLLGREGLTGFVADINSGTLSPRTINLLRCLKGQDRKREWEGDESWPLKMV